MDSNTVKNHKKLLVGGVWCIADLEYIFSEEKWEVDIIRGEMFSNGYGFVVDYLAEVLRTLRNHDFSQKYAPMFRLSNNISTRDRDGIQKTFSGMMKVLYPHEEATPEEIAEILHFAIEGRKRVKEQLMRIDHTYTPVKFYYTDQKDKEHIIRTLEEKEYPQYYQNPSSDQPIDSNSTGHDLLRPEHQPERL